MVSGIVNYVALRILQKSAQGTKNTETIQFRNNDLDCEFNPIPESSSAARSRKSEISSNGIRRVK